MTADISTVSQVSQPSMQWERVDLMRVESREGYQIVAMKMEDGAWVYIASGPKEKVVQENGRMYFRGLEYKARYQQGDQVPPMYSYKGLLARQYIGHFHQVTYGTTESALAAAKAACAEDLAAQAVAGPSQRVATRAQDSAKFR